MFLGVILMKSTPSKSRFCECVFEFVLGKVELMKDKQLIFLKKNHFYLPKAVDFKKKGNHYLFIN